MNTKLCLGLAALLPLLAGAAGAQTLKSDIPYADDGHARHVLDIYTPANATAKNMPVMFWIHGGGWQTGNKDDVALKPKVLTERGFVFVSTTYRLYPEVDMATIIGDCAKSLGWVHKHIAEYGGDPNQLFVGGHSAGAQLAAILCTDDRYLKAEGVAFTSLKGCIPVDGDTYDIPKIIATAEFRHMAYGLPPIGKNGHRQKFGNDPEKHLDFSAVTHIAKGKNIPPFLALFFSGNPDTRAQAMRLGEVLTQAEIPNKVVGKGNSNHSALNNDLGKAGDPVTQDFYKFLDGLTGKATP